MTTIKDIAKKAQVSVATVSYVINGTRTVSPERRKRVLHAVKELNYVPNAVARGLRERFTRTLGLVVSDITHQFYPELAKACEDVARQAGYSLIIMNTNDEENRLSQALMQAREGRVDGLIIASAHLTDRPPIEELVKAGYPVVLAHRRLPGLSVDMVAADNFNGAYSAVRHLITLGHRRIAMMAGITQSSVTKERVEGYKKALSDAGIEMLPEWLVYNTVQHVQLLSHYESSYHSAQILISQPPDKRPTAIFANSDISALGIIDRAQDHSLRVPEDLAVIGCEDLFLASIRSIKLTTVRIPRYELGQTATRLLLNRINQSEPPSPVEIIMPTTLIIRRTCGAADLSPVIMGDK